jgi:hypothetical protein
MADSKRQKIVDAVITRMKLINGTGSYSTNVANRVKDSETNWAQDQDTLPAISVFDGDSISQGKTSVDPHSIIHTMPVLVRGYLEQGTTAAAARTLIKDILTAIRQDDRWTVSGTPLVMQSNEIRDSITRNPDNFEVEACEVEFECQFILQKFNAE